MIFAQKAAHRAGARLQVWRAYARAITLSWRGASVGSRVALGQNCRVERPWGVTLGDRVKLEERVWLKLVDDAAQLSVGNSTFIGRDTQFDVLQNIRIGAHTLIAPHCFITDHNHGIEAGLRIDLQACISSPVTIGSDVWIGANAIILPGVTIGDGAVVGAASVVREDVMPGTIVAGVPARQKGRRG